MPTLELDKSLDLVFLIDFNMLQNFLKLYFESDKKSHGSWPSNITMRVSAELNPEYIARLSYHLFILL